MFEEDLSARDVTYRYKDGTVALEEISLGIPNSRKVAVLGPNGAGKSTLFHHFNGILEPNEGSIFYRENEVTYKKDELKDLRQDVGLVFEDPDSQLFAGSVYREISFGPKNLDLKEKEVEKRVQKAMEVTGIGKLADKPTHHLSFGQKKMVAIAGVIAMEPEVVIFDEPTAGLDPTRSDLIVDFLNRLREKGVTVIISTHDVDLAYSWADHVILLCEGKKLTEGKPGEVFQEKNLLEEANLKSPFLLDIYHSLVEKGLVGSKKLPRDKSELVWLIDNQEFDELQTEET